MKGDYSDIKPTDKTISFNKNIGQSAMEYFKY